MIAHASRGFAVIALGRTSSGSSANPPHSLRDDRVARNIFTLAA